MLSLTPPCVGPPAEQVSLTHYQLLGISRDERDLRVIEESALACTRRIRAYQLTHAEQATRTLNAIAQALITLLDPVRRRQYDRCLDDVAGRAALVASSSRSHRTTTQTKRPPVLLRDDEEVCDVRVVCRRRATV
jgi:hypothetical protein